MNEKRDRWFLGTYMKLLVTQEDASGMSVIEQLAPQGFSPPVHTHHEEDSAIIVLEGSITTRLGDEEGVAHAGQTVFLPRGIPHSFRVDSPVARLLEITTPGGFERFVLDNSEPALAPELPTTPPSIDPAALGASAASHQIALEGPPMA